MDKRAEDSEETVTEDDWLITDELRAAGTRGEEDIEEITIGDDGVENTTTSDATKEEDANSSDDDDYIDMETFEEDNLLEEEDVGELTSTDAKAGDDDNIKLTRTYDLTITYDKYYQTPRVFLFGYGETGQPLGTKQIYEDIMADYVKRTVTMERHPHLGSGELHAAIHPCRHAAVMKSIIGHLMEGGKVPVVDQYLFIFLKFIQSVVPTINYDFTYSVSAR